MITKKNNEYTLKVTWKDLENIERSCLGSMNNTWHTSWQHTQEMEDKIPITDGAKLIDQEKVFPVELSNENDDTVSGRGSAPAVGNVVPIESILSPFRGRRVHTCTEGKNSWKRSSYENLRLKSSGIGIKKLQRSRSCGFYI